MKRKFSNIVLLVIDALRVDRINNKITPFISSLARKGVFFKNAFSVINATDPSFTSIYTGRYPLSHGLIHHGEYVTAEEIRKIGAVPFLQEILQKHGYRTIAIDFLGRWHRKGFNYYSFPVSLLRRVVSKTMPKRIKTKLASWLIKSKTFTSFLTPYDAVKASLYAAKIVRDAFKDKRKFFSSCIIGIRILPTMLQTTLLICSKATIKEEFLIRH